jgi:hypothetical protein
MLRRMRRLLTLALGLAACSGTPGVAAPAPRVVPGAGQALERSVPPEPSERGCWKPRLRAVTSHGEHLVLRDELAFISIAPSASETVRRAAAELALVLAEMTGQPFEIRDVLAANATRGIVLGTARELPQLASDLPAGEWRDEEAFVVRSEAQRLLLVAATDRGVPHAVWDFLHQLGYRRYFPGAAWQIVPRLAELEIRTLRSCRPALHERSLWYGAGDWPDGEPDFAQWSRENRLGGVEIETGHRYAAIVKKHAAEFAAHPEYLARGDASSAKFCVSESGLVELVKRDAARHFEAEPGRLSISMEPSDGGGWDGCEGDAVLGTPSNRALALANAVAASSNVDPLRPRYVGMYAYHEHAPPPSLRVHPNVVVFAANGFLPAGLDVFQVLRGWQAAGERHGGTLLGVREYLSVSPWDRDLPGLALASSPREVSEAIADYYRVGVRFFKAEAGDGWGPHGLGYWTAAGTLWTADNPAPVEHYVEDFLGRAFRGAAAPLRDFYDRIDGASGPLLGPELVGELYRDLARARALEPSLAVQHRIGQLARYLHYLDLWLAYDTAQPPARQEHFEALMRYTYAIRRDHMIHSFGLRRDLAMRDRRVSAPANLRWREPDGDPWRDGAALTDEDVEGWIREGVTRPRLPASPGDAPPRVLALARPEAKSDGPATTQLMIRGSQRLQLVFAAPGSLKLAVRSGIVRQVTAVRVELCEAVAHVRCETRLVPADRAAHDLEFSLPRAGHYTLHLQDFGQGTYLAWPSDTPLALHATARERPRLHGRWSLYLHVPRGTRELLVYSSGGAGLLLDAAGQTAHEFDRSPGVVRVPVPEGMDGACWKFHVNQGVRLPLNVPPWLQASPHSLVRPADRPSQTP